MPTLPKFISIKLGCPWVTAAVALLAALNVPAADLNPARWEKDIAAFEAADRKNPPPTNAVVFVGSSSIRLWTNIASDFPGHKVISRGFGGSLLPDATHFADRIIIPYAPSKVVVYAGDNDIARGHSPERVLADFRAFAEKIHGALPKTKIYYLAIKPSPSRWHLSPQSKEANRLIKRYCAFRPKLAYIDVWTPLLKDDGEDARPDPALFERDRLHLNPQGYARWTKVVRDALKD